MKIETFEMLQNTYTAEQVQLVGHYSQKISNNKYNTFFSYRWRK